MQQDILTRTKNRGVSHRIRSLLLGGMKGDFLTIEEIETLCGVSLLRSGKRCCLVTRGILYAAEHGVVWSRKRGVGIECVKSCNRIRSKSEYINECISSFTICTQ